MDNYVIRYLWTSDQKNWWYHLRVSGGASYSTPRITNPEVKRMTANKVKKTISSIKKNHERFEHNYEIVLEIIDIETHKVVSLKELESILQVELNGGISRFELIDFD